MKKQIRTARVFALGFIGEAEVIEGGGDCLALGIGSYGDTMAVVAQFDSPVLNMLRDEMERNPLRFVSVITLTGQAITDRKELADIAAIAGRQVDLALRDIYAVRFLDGDENKVDVRTNRRGQRFTRREARYEQVVLRDFYCVACRNTGDGDCRRTVDAADMGEVEIGGHAMTIRQLPEVRLHHDARRWHRGPQGEASRAGRAQALLRAAGTRLLLQLQAESVDDLGQSRSVLRQPAPTFLPGELRQVPRNGWHALAAHEACGGEGEDAGEARRGREAGRGSALRASHGSGGGAPQGG